MMLTSRAQSSFPLLLRLGLLAVAVSLAAAWPVQAAVKLYFNDGTFQLVTSYEVRGDRVRYYSAERSAWEEVPLSLVDLAATKKGQQEEAAAKKKGLEEAGEISAERFERPEETGFEVAPGARLPQDEGVFAYDGLRVIRMVQSSADFITDRKRAALAAVLPAPLLKSRALMVLNGGKAAIRISALQPTFYAQLAGGTGTRLELISLKQAKENRVVEKVQAGLGVGKSGEIRTGLPLERTEVAPGIFKLRPVKELAPGEYAIGELLGEKLTMELWDFGIDGAPKPAKSQKAGRSARH